MRKKLFPPEGIRLNLGLVVVILLFFLSLVALLPRLGAERASRNAGIILDYRDLASLASKKGKTVAAAWEEMAARGASGLMVSELTGAQLALGGPPVYYGPAAGLADGARKALGAPLSGTVLFFPKGYEPGRKALPYLALRFPGLKSAEVDGALAILLPRTQEELFTTGVMPDMEGLLLAEGGNIPVFYRVAPSLPGDASQSVASLGALLSDFSAVKTVAPAGETALGFPDMKPMAEAVRREGRSVAMVEFSRQLGAPQLNWLAFPSLLPLHSVTHEELLSRNISRSALYERLMRAVKERSVRLLVFRPSAMEASADPYDAFSAELFNLTKGLSSHGIAPSWPEPFAPWRPGVIGAAALALAFVYSALRYLQRLFLPSAEVRRAEGETGIKGAVLLGGVALILALIIRFVPPAARVTGALTAVLVVVEASFLALDGWRRPWAGLVGSFLFAVGGGLAIAAFFSEPIYMLRLRAFSGVKATLFLPPLLVLLADLKQREHPESLGEIFRRPPLWGELFLMGLLLGGVGLVLFRSDNVQFVPAFEVQIRDFLERVLVARPRSKEVFIGYPSLLLWYYVRKADLWPRYREVFRMGAVLGFSSAVNSFCHFHTPLYFILFRQFNGLWTGVVVGMMAIVILRFAVLPLWDKFGQKVIE